MNSEKKYFCHNPFTYIGVNKLKEFHLCCEGWLPRSIGDAREDSVKAVWNNDIAREIRESILDGSFRYCVGACPYLAEKKGPVQEVDSVTDPAMKKIIENQTVVLDYGPTYLNLAHDPSCDLKCPSCRRKFIQTKTTDVEAYQENKRIQESIMTELKEGLEWLYVNGSGDPFGSILCHELLSSLKQEDYPRLKLYMHSNGQLFNQKNWDSMQGINQAVKRVNISIDAAAPETYALNRGGNWERLNKNLEFISKLRHEGPVESFFISMVVQRNNWREMPQFIDLGRKYRVDDIFFTALQNWGSYLEMDYIKRAVHLDDHPEHKELVKFLGGLSSPPDINVYWGPFACYVDGALSSPPG